MDKKIECFKCRHYFVTWDTSHPRGCRLFGFKTARMPSELVYESTRKKCENYEVKAIYRQNHE